MSDPLFNKSNKDSNDEVDLASITDENAYKLLVGEEGKYKTPEALAKASFFREAHVRNLEKEIADLKAKTTEQMTISDLIAKLEKPPVIDTPKQPDKKMDESLDIRTEVQKLVEAELAKRNGESTKSLNINKVIETLKNNWGANYQTILENKASQLGTTKEQLVELASNHPALFLSAVGAQEKRTAGEAPTASSTILSGRTGGTGLKDYKYYQDMKKKDPKAYHTPAIQRERVEMATKLGDKFFS